MVKKKSFTQTQLNKVTKAELVTWLKKQRHENTKIGRIGYQIHMLGIWFCSREEIDHLKRAYLRYKENPFG